MGTSPTTDHVIYLHGWGEDPTDSPLAVAVYGALASLGRQVHSFGYHPSEIQATRVDAALRDLSRFMNDPGTSRNVRVIGYSFGGLLAALFAQRYPERIARMVLVAPAIDNIARNYSGDPATWRMPREFVAELGRYRARPAIVCPTTLVYGDLDDDTGGSSPERYREWAREQKFAAVHELQGVDHDLEPWLTTGEPKPSLQELVKELMV